MTALLIISWEVFLLGAVVVGLIFRITRGSTSEQDPALDLLWKARTLPCQASESSSDTDSRTQATRSLPGPEQPQLVWQLLIQGCESQIPVSLAY